MRWETKRSFDGKLCQEYSCQKLSKSDNWFLSYSQKCRGCCLGHSVDRKFTSFSSRLGLKLTPILRTTAQFFPTRLARRLFVTPLLNMFICHSLPSLFKQMRDSTNRTIMKSVLKIYVRRAGSQQQSTAVAWYRPASALQDKRQTFGQYRRCANHRCEKTFVMFFIKI